MRRFDTITLALMAGAAAGGALWANYNRGLATALAPEDALRPHVWATFAIPFALFLGWIIARWREGWLALFVCFCLYFFSPFVAARYESCVVLAGSFSLRDCFFATADAQTAASANGHALYFQSIIVFQLVVALGIALQRALSRSTMPDQAQPRPHSELSTQNAE